MAAEFETVNPTTEELIKTYSAESVQEIELKVKKADAAFHEWRKLSLEVRLGFVSKLAQVLRSQKKEYAELKKVMVDKKLKKKFKKS